MLFGLHWTTESTRFLNGSTSLNRTATRTEQKTRQDCWNELGDLRELSQRHFTYQFNRDQRLAESHCPRVFSLRPQEAEKWPKLKRETVWNEMDVCSFTARNLGAGILLRPWR